jgi:hypothetical protein
MKLMKLRMTLQDQRNLVESENPKKKNTKYRENK